MIYFHSNDKIAYLSITGVEKVLLLEKVVRRNKTTINFKEFSNCYYNESALIRRVFVD